MDKAPQMTSEQLSAALSDLPGERVTAEFMESRISETNYLHVENTNLTICLIKLDNGYIFTGESACVDPENYNKEIGDKLAFDAAFRKMWPFFGFLLAEKRFVCSEGAAE